MGRPFAPGLPGSSSAAWPAATVRVTDISRVSSQSQAHWRRIGEHRRNGVEQLAERNDRFSRRYPPTSAPGDAGRRLIQTRRDDDDRRPLAPRRQEASALISSKPSIFRHVKVR